MSIKRTLFKNSTLNILAYIYLLGLSFVSIPILLGTLGSAKFGLYILLASTIPLAASFELGISQATIRQLSLSTVTKKEKKKIWRTSLFIYIRLAVLVSLITFLVVLYVIPNLAGLEDFGANVIPLALLLGLIVFINHLNIFLLTLPQSQQRFDIYNSRALIVGTGNTLFTALLSQMTTSLLHLFSLQIIFHFVMFLILLNHTKTTFKKNFFSPQLFKNHARLLGSFGVRNFVGRLATQIKNQISNFALGGLLSVSAIAAFNIPQNLVIKAAGAVSQLTLSFFPLSTSLTTKQRIHKLASLMVFLEVLIFIGGIMFIFIVHRFGFQFLLWWLKDAQVVESAYPILKVLSFFFLLTSLTPLPTALMDSINHPHIPSIFATLNAVITIILIYVMTPQYGALGPAYATLITSSFLSPIFIIYSVITFNRFKNNLLNS